MAGLLWPDWPERSARANLRRALVNLRQAIRDHQSASDAWIDVTAFTDLLEAKGTLQQLIGQMEKAVALAEGYAKAGQSRQWKPVLKKQSVIVKEINCKSILTKSGIEGVDYALNPYVGCAHGCVYCYASFMKRFTGHTEEWGTFVDVKVNAAEVLARQMRRAKRGNIASGTVTDPYQPLEERYEITRACLRVLMDYDLPISILTKSDLVLRDLDILRRLKDVEVGFTITTLEEEVQRFFEPGSPPASARLAALTELAEVGVKTWAFCGPLLPFLSDSEGQIDALFAELARAGVSYIIVDSIKLSGAIGGKVRRVLERNYPDLVEGYRHIAANRRPYHEALMTRAQRLAAKHGLAWRV